MVSSDKQVKQRENGYYFISVPKGLCDDIIPGFGLFLLINESLCTFMTKGQFCPTEEWFKDSKWIGPLKPDNLCKCKKDKESLICYGQNIYDLEA